MGLTQYIYNLFVGLNCIDEGLYVVQVDTLDSLPEKEGEHINIAHYFLETMTECICLIVVKQNITRQTT